MERLIFVFFKNDFNTMISATQIFSTNHPDPIILVKCDDILFYTD